MALQAEVNSFVSLSEADDYFENRINSDLWFADTTCDQDQALVTASGILDRMVWAGTCTPTSSYPLSWPRDITYFDSKSGDNITLEDDRDDDTDSAGTIPEDIKKATCELALHLLRNSSDLEDSEDGKHPVKDITLGTLRLTFETKRNRNQIVDVPSVVWDLVNKYLSTSKTSRGVFVSGGA